MIATSTPLVGVRDLVVRYGSVVACDGIDLDVFRGEVLGIVGESGSGKTTLLRAIAGTVPLAEGTIAYRDRDDALVQVDALPLAARRRLLRTEWGLVHQNPRDGLRLGVSAGANVAERLLDAGLRNYATIRATVERWMDIVELDRQWIDALPTMLSGGMQQRLQLARILVTEPRLVLMDEPTGGLDVSVQARLLDTIRSLVRRLGLSVVLVTHDIGVVRLLADRLLVMRAGRVIESGLTDQVLDDPQHPYTQLLVSAALTP
jgi:putative phosphonate transport system ATP-binding protein